MIRRWWRRTSGRVPQALVRVSRSDGRPVPVRYVRADRGRPYDWTAVVQVPLLPHDVPVYLDVRTPRTAVLLEPEWA